ncbi:universal stress protein [Marinicella rhabdoformis]|uniref:universal stress protein n=1 Tax=Marinicella rhabdoformis TaxID=2580566 RepID=UPI0012AECCDD|nr:universal stress protein [Marinicella rhabdoformis]
MKVVCVPVIDRPECAVALNTAFELSQSLDAAVMGYHLRAHRESAVNLPEAVSEMVNGDENNPSDSENNQQSAEKLFARLADMHGYVFKKKASAAPVALWQAKTGSPDKLFSIIGPVTDMIVVSRPKKGGKVARKFMLSALLNSAKPVMILPQKPTKTVGKKICIAWNQSPEAARAVAAAMPLIKQADQVTIMSNGTQNRLGPKVKHLKQYLTMHGINANHIKLKSKKDATALVKAYKESESDLLVMGAYSKSRLRQVIFGGVTEHMLFSADIPVFMLHS